MTLPPASKERAFLTASQPAAFRKKPSDNSVMFIRLIVSDTAPVWQLRTPAIQRQAEEFGLAVEPFQPHAGPRDPLKMLVAGREQGRLRKHKLLMAADWIGSTARRRSRLRPKTRIRESVRNRPLANAPSLNKWSARGRNLQRLLANPFSAMSADRRTLVGYRLEFGRPGHRIPNNSRRIWTPFQHISKRKACGPARSSWRPSLSVVGLIAGS